MYLEKCWAVGELIVTDVIFPDVVVDLYYV